MAVTMRAWEPIPGAGAQVGISAPSVSRGQVTRAPRASVSSCVGGARDTTELPELGESRLSLCTSLTQRRAR